MSAGYYKYWGKAKKLEDGSYDYHLLVYHSLDVAAVGKIWIEKNPAFLKKAYHASGLSGKAFTEWFLFFLALHDVGKFRLSFQNLCPDILAKLQGREKLDLPYSVRHDQLGYELYEEYLYDYLYDAFFNGINKIPLKEYLDIFAYTSFGHHGIPPKGGAVRKKQEVIFAYVDKLSELFLSIESIQEISSLLNLEKAERREILNGFKQLSWQLAGITTLCDWLASGDESFFFCPDEVDLKVYFDDSIQKAEKAIERAEIIPAPISSDQGLMRLFPRLAEIPTPLQEYCNEIPVTEEPQLWILEDVTGSGKTEAALTLASRILGEGGGTGCFVALPTMATSNAMYERMSEIYSRLYQDGYRPSLSLSHGSRHLSEKFWNSYHDSLDSVPHKGEILESDMDEGKAHCSQWLADSSKKALLADVGVGTVDQILLAGLPVRYQSLRAFSMSQKILIIDEVHAYDAYMLTLLENIITAQAAFGQSVILLSATLPFSIREKFCRAFSSGINKDYIPIKQKNSFPLVTSVSAENINETQVETRKSVARSVAVDFCENIEDVYRLIDKSVATGKCVCWIRNTVADVVESFEELCKRKTENLDMFHSRFALKDRLDIEKRILNRFGKNSTFEDRKGQVLVASQVVEQSLDLDFDVMISDLAPIDLLIQRAGRLHRHERSDRANPVFYVHAPQNTAEPSANWFAEAFPKAQWVYKDTALLWRTKEILKKQKQLKMPDEARLLIESVYGDDERIEAPDVFQESENEAWGKSMADKSLANFNQLKFCHGYSLEASAQWDKDERVPTRLSEPTNTLYLCRWENEHIVPFYHDDRFPWDINSLSLRASSLTSVSYDDEIQNEILTLQKQKRFKYDTLFLVFSGKDFSLIGNDQGGKEIQVSYDPKKGLMLKKEGS